MENNQNNQDDLLKKAPGSGPAEEASVVSAATSQNPVTNLTGNAAAGNGTENKNLPLPGNNQATMNSADNANAKNESGKDFNKIQEKGAATAPDKNKTAGKSPSAKSAGLSTGGKKGKTGSAKEQDPFSAADRPGKVKSPPANNPQNQSNLSPDQETNQSEYSNWGSQNDRDQNRASGPDYDNYGTQQRSSWGNDDNSYGRPQFGNTGNGYGESGGFQGGYGNPRAHEDNNSGYPSASRGGYGLQEGGNYSNNSQGGYQGSYGGHGMRGNDYRDDFNRQNQYPKHHQPGGHYNNQAPEWNDRSRFNQPDNRREPDSYGRSRRDDEHRESNRYYSGPNYDQQSRDRYQEPPRQRGSADHVNGDYGAGADYGNQRGYNNQQDRQGGYNQQGGFGSPGGSYNDEYRATGGGRGGSRDTGYGSPGYGGGQDRPDNHRFRDTGDQYRGNGNRTNYGNSPSYDERNYNNRGNYGNNGPQDWHDEQEHRSRYQGQSGYNEPGQPRRGPQNPRDDEQYNSSRQGNRGGYEGQARRTSYDQD